MTYLYIMRLYVHLSVHHIFNLNLHKIVRKSMIFFIMEHVLVHLFICPSGFQPKITQNSLKKHKLANKYSNMSQIVPRSPKATNIYPKCPRLSQICPSYIKVSQICQVCTMYRLMTSSRLAQYPSCCQSQGARC